MGYAWLLRRLAYLAGLAAVPTSLIAVLVRDWNRVVAFLNGTWPQWVSNVANIVQIGGLIVALAWWVTRAARSRSTEPGAGLAAARLLGLLALLLPARDRERFVREVTANMADRQRRWQRVEELLSVAAAVPGLAVILRWARRRRA